MIPGFSSASPFRMFVGSGADEVNHYDSDASTFTYVLEFAVYCRCIYVILRHHTTRTL